MFFQRFREWWRWMMRRPNFNDYAPEFDAHKFKFDLDEWKYERPAYQRKLKKGLRNVN